MQHTDLGTSGPRVSRVGLGGMSFGEASPVAWVLDDEAAEPVFRAAVESGVTFWDTASCYGNGTSEDVVGRAARRYTRREDVVLAAKTRPPGSPGPAASGSSRAAVLAQVDATLTWLGTDHVDLFQLYRHDDAVPVEEAVEALHDVVRAGKVRHLGAAFVTAGEFAALQAAAREGGWTEFVSLQDEHSAVRRERRRELSDVLAGGVSLVGCSPLAGGRLARPRGRRTTTRAAVTPEVDLDGRPLLPPEDRAVVDVVQEIARARRVPMARVALAWVLADPAVVPLVGATRADHVTDAVAALDLVLSDEEMTALDAAHVPRPPRSAA